MHLAVLRTCSNVFSYLIESKTLFLTWGCRLFLGILTTSALSIAFELAGPA